MRSQHLNVFVYGTLKRGQRNHGRLCDGLVTAREATVRGRLYDLPYGYPALVVPEEDIFATGTTDYPADAERGRAAEAGPQGAPSGWGTVYGEIFGFDDPEERLPALDDLEGFHPDEESFYRRVLIPATPTPTGTTVLVWAYAIESESGVYLPDGRWPAP